MHGGTGNKFTYLHHVHTQAASDLWSWLWCSAVCWHWRRWLQWIQCLLRQHLSSGMLPKKWEGSCCHSNWRQHCPSLHQWCKFFWSWSQVYLISANNLEWEGPPDIHFASPPNVTYVMKAPRASLLATDSSASVHYSQCQPMGLDYHRNETVLIQCSISLHPSVPSSFTSFSLLPLPPSVPSSFTSFSLLPLSFHPSPHPSQPSPTSPSLHPSPLPSLPSSSSPPSIRPLPLSPPSLPPSLSSFPLKIIPSLLLPLSFPWYTQHRVPPRVFCCGSQPLWTSLLSTATIHCWQLGPVSSASRSWTWEIQRKWSHSVDMKHLYYVWTLTPRGEIIWYAFIKASEWLVGLCNSYISEWGRMMPIKCAGGHVACLSGCDHIDTTCNNKRCIVWHTCDANLTSFPGLHVQLMLLAVWKAGEGLEGFIMWCMSLLTSRSVCSHLGLFSPLHSSFPEFSSFFLFSLSCESNCYWIDCG